MDINFQQLMSEAGEGFQPIPPGPYTVEVEKAEATKSSTSKPQIKVTLRVLGGDHNGRKLFDQYTLTAGNPAALGFFFDNMAAFGLDRSFFSQLTMGDPMPYVAQMLLGRQCNVAVALEPYQGVDRNKIKQYRPIQGGQPAMQQGGMPGMPNVPTPGAMPVMQQPAPQPQYTPQPQPQYAQPAPAPAPVPQGPPAGFPQVPQPQVAPVQEQPQPQYAPQTAQPAPWQQAQEFPPQQPQGNPGFPQQPVAPGEQQGQPQAAPMWQPSGPPPGYDPSQQQAPQPPQGVPPMPGRSI